MRKHPAPFKRSPSPAPLLSDKKDLVRVMRDFGLSRRQMLSVMGLGAAGAGLAACGSPVGNESSDEGSVRSEFSQADMNVPSQYEGRTNILFWAPFTAEIFHAVEAQFEKFNESQDEIYAAAESVGNYEDLTTQFTAAIQARQVPDLVCFPEMRWMQFYLSDNLAPLDDYFDDEWSLDVYIQNYVGESMAAGETFVVPFARSAPLFYYNKTLFEELGLPADGPGTWEEFRDMAPELAGQEVAGQSVQPFAFGDADGWYSSSHVWAWGGQWSDGLEVTADSDAVHEWLEWKRTFIHDDGFGHMAQEPTTNFQTGAAACCHASTGLRAADDETDFEIGSALLLGKDEPAPPVPTGGAGLSVVKSGSQERQDACAELLRFLAKPENSAQWHVDTTYVPIVIEAQETQLMRDRLAEDPGYSVVMDQIENLRTVDPICWFTSSVQEIGQSMARVYGDNEAVDGVVADLQSELESIMESNRDGLEQVLAE